MDKHTFDVLEYESIIDIISTKTTNIYGKNKIRGRYPLKDIELINLRQQETREALKILNSMDVITVGALDDINVYLKMAQKGIPLKEKDILKVYEVLSRSRAIKKYISVREVLLPNLYKASEVISIFFQIEKDISNALDKEGNIIDSASVKLKEIRNNIKILNTRIQKQLDNFIRNSDYIKMLQEPIITQREHRYVLPVKQEYRSKFPGLVLDASASGATLFMEPTTVLKLTNELKFQKNEEEREMEQIRLKLSKKIGSIAGDIFNNLEFLGHFDALQASARYLIDCDGSIPQIIKEPFVELKNARHPLLGKKSVPIDIHVGRDFLGLIITGPNTGGKTVSLKTTGVLVLLGLSGFPIPADESSKIGLFTGVFADIGDEQSISQNLSTFSSHISNIKKILPRTGKHTLVLFDELGAGTDPSEGVALASSILKYLIRNKARVIATTHYNELKILAGENKKLANAAVEFNEETLEPTYKIKIGLPGRSCAIKIASRLGVPKEIIDDAHNIMGPGHFKLENLLSELDKEKDLIIKERENVSENREALEKLKSQYDDKIAHIEQEKNQIFHNARQEAENLIDGISQELKEAQREWRKSLKNYRQGKKTKEELKEQNISFKSHLEKTIQKLQKFQKEEVKDKEECKSFSFSQGDLVEVKTLNRRGKIIRIEGDDQALVEVGNIKIETPLKNLELSNLEFAQEPEPIREMRLSKAQFICDELDLRGQRADEALENISKYLDDALLANLSHVRILHGKGTGALRESIRIYLKDNSVVKSFRDGDIHEGGWGVTVVELKNYE